MKKHRYSTTAMILNNLEEHHRHLAVQRLVHLGVIVAVSALIYYLFG